MATETPTVFQAWNAVMRDVQAVAKTGRNQQQNYSFRGIDAVLDAAGPATREHGVIVMPTGKEVHYRDVEVGQKRTLMREVTVKVRYSIIGPGGDVLTVEGEPDFGTVYGESMDSGDKGTAKAMSVAYRIFLIQALMIPTNEPDPDEHSYERANRSQPTVPSVPLNEAMQEVEAKVGGDVDAARQAWQAAGLGGEKFVPRDRLDAALAEAGRIIADHEASADATDAAADSEPGQPELPPVSNENGHAAYGDAQKSGLADVHKGAS